MRKVIGDGSRLLQRRTAAFFRPGQQEPRQDGRRGRLLVLQVLEAVALLEPFPLPIEPIDLIGSEGDEAEDREAPDGLGGGKSSG